MSQHLCHPLRPSSDDRRPVRALCAAALSAGLSLTLLAPASALAQDPSRSSTCADDWAGRAFRGHVDVAPGPDADQHTLDGVVFDDRNRNSQHDPGEHGIAGMEVSNGSEIVTTDRQGRYEISVRDGETVSITQPAGYQAPADEANVAQFFYAHMPQGSADLKYGGIQPTGPLPEAVDFPLARTTDTLSRDQNCLIGGDIQTYTQEEVDYALQGAFADLAQRSDYTGCGALFIGDIVGDDLDLYAQTRELTSQLNGPARFLPGNHDLDFDADYDHRFDTYRSQFGPEYYSYDAGDVHVVSLNTVQHSQGAPYNGTYNGGIDDEQLQWLRDDIERTPEDKLIVLAAHIPLLNWHDQGSDRHQVDQVREIHEIIGERPAVALGGHGHTLEVMREGDSMEGWRRLYGVEELPFDHITAGAISGDWHSGRMTDSGYPTALQRDGAVPRRVHPGGPWQSVSGLLHRHRPSGLRADVAGAEHPGLRRLVPGPPRAPRSGPRVRLPARGLGRGSGRVLADDERWAGGTGTEFSVSFDGRPAQKAERTQQLEGESKHVGAEFSDPAAVQEQLVHGGSAAESSGHLWRLDLPEDLAVGEHTATVTQTDRYGVSTTQQLAFTVTS